MKASNVIGALALGAVCFATGWLLPSPLADAVRCVSDFQIKIRPETLEVFVDRETGCEYVGLEKGALTPRVSADGRQICKLQ
ncbi:DUF6440 family protein [Paraburkholderia adhaesiva]|uniref:DUF6440 family protein n=1 Tax=Paraburkholderia adhaesiva TaxID=2883244 RepID=UPI001F2AD95C|nr:DUF6440 family protein [Paraburkholderia adhaesiva]